MMSLDACGRIKTKCIDEDFLEENLIAFFSPKSDIIRSYNEKYVIYDGMYSENKVTVFFKNEATPPYNVYDSNIINDEFEYAQLILFAIKKEEASIDIYRDIICFCIYLKGKIDSDILVTSEVHDDICLLKGKEIIWSKDLSFDYSGII